MICKLICNMDWLSILLLLAFCLGNYHLGDCETQPSAKFRIAGKVSVPSTVNQDWVSTTRVLVDGGRHLGFLRYILACSMEQQCSSLHFEISLELLVFLNTRLICITEAMDHLRLQTFHREVISSRFRIPSMNINPQGLT